jgi:hypothetical protein
VLERFELTVAVTFGKLGVRTPVAFKYMRKALGLKSAELAQFFDAGLRLIQSRRLERST